MLPGPPNECLPIFEQVILPELKKRSQQLYRKKWLLFAVSEGHTADQLDTLVPENVEVGYRVNYPYLEVKLFSYDQVALENTAEKFLPIFAENLVDEGRETYSQKLSKQLNHAKQPIRINDQATHGLLEKTLVTKENVQNIVFTDVDPQIIITGLDNWWQEQAAETTTLTITIDNNVQHHTIPYRAKKSRFFAVELISCQLLAESLLED